LTIDFVVEGATQARVGPYKSPAPAACMLLLVSLLLPSFCFFFEPVLHPFFAEKKATTHSVLNCIVDRPVTSFSKYVIFAIQLRTTYNY
jgi:hypothetical protein